jgi:hypothetical protein
MTLEEELLVLTAIEGGAVDALAAAWIRCSTLDPHDRVVLGGISERLAEVTGRREPVRLLASGFDPALGSSLYTSGKSDRVFHALVDASERAS